MSRHVFIFLCFLLSCNLQGTTEARSQNADDLYREAILIYRNNGSSPDSIWKAINLLSEAVKNRDTFWEAYQSKISLLCELGETELALTTVNSLLNRQTKPTDIKMIKGFLLEKQGRLSEATQSYIELTKDYKNMLKQDSVNVDLQVRLAYTSLFLNEDTARIMFEKIKTENPNNFSVLAHQDIFRDFDRQKYIKSFCSGEIFQE